MSPFSTFQSCGSSSRLYLRRNLPNRDTRIIGDLEEWATALVQPDQVFFQPVRASDHGPKFVAIKFTATFAHTQRAINHRTMRPELNRNADHQHQRPKEKQSKGGHEYIHDPLQYHPHPNDGLRSPSRAIAIRDTLDE